MNLEASRGAHQCQQWGGLQPKLAKAEAQGSSRSLADQGPAPWALHLLRHQSLLSRSAEWSCRQGWVALGAMLEVWLCSRQLPGAHMRMR